MIKHFDRDKKNHLSKSQINLALAEKIIKALPNINDFESIRASYLNKIDLNLCKDLKSSIECFITEDTKELFYNIVLKSKKSDLIDLAASNAITLLNKSGFSFANKDLSRIKIPNADLSWGLFINTNFESSYLYGVNFSQAHIYDSNFRNCNMLNANFGKSLISGLRKDARIIKFSPCGRFLAIATESELFLYDAKTYKQISELKESKDLVYLLFSDDGNYLGWHSKDETMEKIILWDVSTKLLIAKFSDNYIFFSFSPCNIYLCLVQEIKSYKKLVKIFSIKTKQIINEIRWLDSTLKFLSFLPSMENLIICNHQTLSIWNLYKKTIINQIGPLYLNNMSISFNRKYIANHKESDQTILYSSERLELLMNFAGCCYLIFSYCGKYLALETAYPSVKVFNLSKGKWYSEILAERPLDFYPGTKYGILKRICASKSKWLKTRLNGKINNKFHWRERVAEVSFSDDSKYFAVLTFKGKISIFITESQKLLKKFSSLESLFIKHIAWSNIILATTHLQSIKFWDIYDGSLLKEISTLRQPELIVFSPDGKKIISSGYRCETEIFDIDSSQRIFLFKNGFRTDAKWFWSKSENFVISVDSSKIKIFKIENQKSSANFLVITRFLPIAQSFCKDFLISYGELLTVWYLRDLTFLNKVKEIHHNYELVSVIWSYDRNNIIAGDNKGSIIVWNYDKGKVVKKISAHKKSVSPINISKKGHFISCGYHEAIKLWEFNLLR